MRIFKDRQDAGRQLGQALVDLKAHGELIVLALPRGGVPVGFEVARELIAPLDVFIVRKLGVPGHEELAFGAIASGGTRVLNDDLVDSMDLSDDVIAKVTSKEQREVERRESLYRGGKPPLLVAGKVVVLVDDGAATGATMLAAVKALRELGPEQIIAGVPVAPEETCQLLHEMTDRTICLHTPFNFRGVSDWFEDFSQTTDEDVTRLLAKAGTWWRGFEPVTQHRRSTDL